MTYDQILQDDDLVMVNRGGVNYKVTGAQVHAHLGVFQDTDLFMVQSTVEPVGDPQPALYSVSFGTLKNSPKALLNSPSDYFLVERDNQLFSVENPFRRGTGPGFLCTIDTSGLDNPDRAFTFSCVGAVNQPGYPTPAVYYLKADNSVAAVDTLVAGQSGSELLVSDANDLGITKAVIKGVFSKIGFPQALGMTTCTFQGGTTEAWNQMIRTPNPDNGRFMFALCKKLTHCFGMTGYGPAMPQGMLKHLGGAFRGCELFNGDISTWDTSEVTDMSDCFGKAVAFNQDISGWNTAKVQDMSYMFDGATAFDQPLNSWDVRKVLNFQIMFNEASTFNKPLNNWVLEAANGPNRNINALDKMFKNAGQFNQDLTGWCVSEYSSEPAGFAEGSALNPANLPVWGTCP